MRRAFPALLGLFAPAVFFVYACVSDDPVPAKPTTPVADAGSPTPMDAGGGNLKCETDEKICNEQCVKIENPLFGCSATECSPCSDAPFVDQITCKQGKCEAATCVSGRGDCDMAYPNGCETSTITSQKCGSCSNTCSGAAPLCAENADGGLGCTANCASAGLTSCGDAGACVNTATSTQNCGACGKTCTAPVNGITSCAASSCVPSCRTGSKFNTDGGACITDPKSCLAATQACSGNVQCCSGSCRAASATTRPTCSCTASGAPCSGTADTNCCKGLTCKPVISRLGSYACQ